jgi:hypothetical protein
MSDNDRLVDSWMPEFRHAHANDPRNAARQSFEDYWGWVKTFLVTGAAGQRGWLDQGDVVLGRIQPGTVADALRARLLAIGRTIAAEWAKDGRYRRIYTTFFQGTPNLQNWGRRLQRAAASDTGDGTAIGQALDTIERDVRSAVGDLR